VERRCPECDGILTALTEAAEMTAGRAEYLCSECQLVFVYDAANGLREAN
jgi:hypothetical protein